MMKTPICGFLDKYASEDSVRLHMPGHKGRSDIEKLDITEISGADSLYSANGIIAESEGYAGELFGARTLFSAEGSSLSIRAMLYLAAVYAKDKLRRPLILAGRNAHKSFISGVALLGVDVEWLPSLSESYLSGKTDLKYLEKRLSEADTPAAVYLTTPDYLGFMDNVCEVAKLCHRHGVLLLVDNAHGAYLKFIKPSLHPIDLGADMCADSAHKTLPALTGAAYLHISKSAPDTLYARAREALAIFGSTSPSYLILASLDRTNEYLSDGFRENLSVLISRLEGVKEAILSHGYTIVGDEPMKLTIFAKPYGYTGAELAGLLSVRGIIADFADPDYVVLMPTPENSDSDLDRLVDALQGIPRRAPIESPAPVFSSASVKMTAREAILSPALRLPLSECIGRTLATASVSCPPAVPILVPGEVVDEASLKAFEYYGIDALFVVK